MTIKGLSVGIVRKAIKNLHIGVYPPNGRVRVAAPTAMEDEAIRLAVIRKLGWINRQRGKFEGQARQSQREMVDGESHYYQGRRYRIRVVEHNGPAKVEVRSNGFMIVHVRSGSTAEQREQGLLRWYRAKLKEIIPPLIEKWESVLGVSVTAWGVKKMKTKWGSCNTSAGRVWLNLELAKKPVECLEYIVVHEMIHLLTRHHSPKFIALMDEHLPNWRFLRDRLNRAPLGHENWLY